MKKEILLLQQEMAAQGLHACLIPTADFHQSEYVNDYFKARQYLTGFTGSAGTLIVTASEAGLWTDGRYFLQAENQLAGSGITLFRMGEKDVPSTTEYLQKVLPQGCRLAVDGRTISAAFGKQLEKITTEKSGELCINEDPVSKVWSGRPALTSKVPFILEEIYSGKSAADKLAGLREDIKNSGAEVHVLTMLDDIAWLLNLRGDDILHNPVFYSFAAVTAEEALLFALPEAISPEIGSYLEGLGVKVMPYDSFYQEMTELCKDKKVLVDPKKINYRLHNVLKNSTVVAAMNPTTRRKAVKNAVEVECERNSHRKDGLAMVKFIHWLKTNVGRIPMTELSASDYLAQCRLEQEGCIDLSFVTIAGYGPNGAIVHYIPTPETDTEIKPEGFLLVDSGGQYLDGTTDITRTIVLGPVTQEMKEHFTIVLRSMISLAKVRFMKGCTGANLDILARAPFWDLGMDYNHGSGHGIGFLLNVHEGPNGFHWRTDGGRTTCAFEPGMVTTDEPGIYIAGSHGIRTENELLCVEDRETAYGSFLKFETLTMCPIDREAILPEMMTKAELDFLNEYHEKVYQVLKDGLAEEDREWLREVTLPITASL